MTVTNLTRGQSFTPILVATHEPGVKLFTLGQVAIQELAILAEASDVGPLSASLIPQTWEIDHSKPRANGGTDHGNNLKPALVSANRSKQAMSSRSVRRVNGLSRSPMSAAEQGRKRTGNTVGGAAAGAAAGAMLAGPPGALVGGLVGALIGNGRKVK